MMFVDASAIVAILTREPEAEALTDVLEKGQSPITSPIAIFEAALGICRKRHASVEEAGEDVREFLAVLFHMRIAFAFLVLALLFLLRHHQAFCIAVALIHEVQGGHDRRARNVQQQPPGERRQQQ